MRIEAWKRQDFNRVSTRDLAIPVWRSNQLSYEATDVGKFSFASSDHRSNNHHSSLDFKSAVQYLKHFIYITSHPFFTGSFITAMIVAHLINWSRWTSRIHLFDFLNTSAHSRLINSNLLQIKSLIFCCVLKNFNLIN